jgi:hypothetical protein
MLEKELYGKTHYQLEMDDVLAAKDLGEDHVVEDWPWGRKQRCSMHFYVETTKRGQRFCKQSTFKGRVNKAKCSTYASRVTIVEIDGKIGQLELTASMSHVGVRMQDGRYLESTFFDEEAVTIAKHFFGKK